MLIRDGYRGVALEGDLAREHLVEHDAGRIEVASPVDVLALRLLGREVRGGAEDGSGLRDGACRVGDGTGDTEVHDLDRVFRRDHDVSGLDVAVYDSGAVRVLERGEDARHVLVNLGVGERGARHDVAELLPLDVLHDDVRDNKLVPVCANEGVLARVEDSDDRGVRHASGGLGLLPEARTEVRLTGELRIEELDGDAAAEALIGPEIDLSHTSTTNSPTDVVSASERAFALHHGSKLLSPWQCSPSSSLVSLPILSRPE